VRASSRGVDAHTLPTDFFINELLLARRRYYFKRASAVNMTVLCVFLCDARVFSVSRVLCRQLRGNGSATFIVNNVFHSMKIIVLFYIL